MWRLVSGKHGASEVKNVSRHTTKEAAEAAKEECEVLDAEST
jgi:hypothetical protein